MLYASPPPDAAIAIPLLVSIRPECDVQTTYAGQSAVMVDGSGNAEVSGTVKFQYRIRTSTAGGGGALRLRLSGTGVPGGALSYTVSLTGAGSSVSGQQRAPGDIVAVTFGPDAHTGRLSETGVVAWRFRFPVSQPPPAPTAVMSCSAY
jgi:hypothetical protein